MKDQVITSPFSVADTQGGMLKGHLIEEDYLATQKVFFTNLH